MGFRIKQLKRGAASGGRGVRHLLIILGIQAVFVALPAQADITGPARVVNGDTIDIAGQRIRLFGIDAPESGQTCIIDNQPWPCGEAATEALRRHMHQPRHPSGCALFWRGAEPLDLGRYRHPLPRPILG